MVKPEVISDIVYDMQFKNFCPQAVEDTVEKQRDCAEKVILTMPRYVKSDVRPQLLCRISDIRQELRDISGISSIQILYKDYLSLV